MWSVVFVGGLRGLRAWFVVCGGVSCRRMVLFLSYLCFLWSFSRCLHAPLKNEQFQDVTEVKNEHLQDAPKVKT